MLHTFLAASVGGIRIPALHSARNPTWIEQHPTLMYEYVCCVLPKLSLGRSLTNLEGLQWNANIHDHLMPGV
jgi:hypothetical protein